MMVNKMILHRKAVLYPCFLIDFWVDENRVRCGKIESTHGWILCVVTINHANICNLTKIEKNV